MGYTARAFLWGLLVSPRNTIEAKVLQTKPAKTIIALEFRNEKRKLTVMCINVYLTMKRAVFWVARSTI